MSASENAAFARLQAATEEMRLALTALIPEGRYRALAMTDLERVFLWAVAHQGVETLTEQKRQAARAAVAQVLGGGPKP